MNNHHRFASFQTFNKRVLGVSSVDQTLFDEGRNKLSYHFDILDDGETPTLNLSLNACDRRFNNFFKFKANQSYSSKALVIARNFDDLATVIRILDELDNAELISAKKLLSELIKCLEKGRSLSVLFKANIEKRVFCKQHLEQLLNMLVEISVLTEMEAQLTNVLLDNLDSLLSNRSFVAEANNIRCIQQLLSFSASNDFTIIEKVANLAKPITSEGEDALVAIILSVVSNTETFSSTIAASGLTTIAQPVQIHQRTIETLARSPVKISFAANSPYLQGLLSGLSLAITPHAKLLFKAFYFVANEDAGLLDSINFHHVLVKVLSFNDKEFNELYCDVRRSKKNPSEIQQFLKLIRNVNLPALSLNKIMYLFTLVPENISEQERLLLLTRVMLDKGIACINNEYALTLAASLNLKQLSNQIINDTLEANQLLPVLPSDGNYDLKTVFDSILITPPNKVEDEAECISVVLTTYNPDMYFLTQSLKSIVQQTYSNLEIILIDDCSEPEKSIAIEKLCDAIDERQVTYYRNNANVGQYVSRNIAISMAQGNYIAIQDDDDVSHPQRLSFQLKHMLKNQSLACFSKHVRYSDDGSLSVDDPRNLLVFGDGPATLLFQKDLINIIGGFRNFRSRGDIDFRTRIKTLLGESAISNISIPLYFMRSSLTTISSLYEYFNGDQLVFFRKRIDLLKSHKTLEKVATV